MANVELELNLKKIAAEVKEITKAMNEFANELEQIEKKFASSVPGLTIPQETVTEFADRCRECGARYGRLLNQKWIPVSEGTPKEEETVIASTKYGVYPEARYTKEYGWEWAYESGADYWVELDDVEAWMPLPKRYEPEAEGGKS